MPEHSSRLGLRQQHVQRRPHQAGGQKGGNKIVVHFAGVAGREREGEAWQPLARRLARPGHRPRVDHVKAAVVPAVDAGENEVEKGLAFPSFLLL